MEKETLVLQCRLPVGSDEYDVSIFCRPDGSHVAKTVLDGDDVIINNGSSLDDTLNRHRELLPLAINSRQLFTDAKNSEKNDPTGN